MTKRLLFLCALVSVLLLAGDASPQTGAAGSQAGAPSPQYPILDMIANKVVQKYQQSTCEQLWLKKSKKAPPTAEEQKVLGILKADPQMRTAFINKVAAPIANKMFECGMIP
jgi:hypothetical protein